MTNIDKRSVSRRGPACRSVAAAACGVWFAAVIAANATAAPAAGDSWVYRVVNGYNNEVRGKIQYRVDQVDADRFALRLDERSRGAGRNAYRSLYARRELAAGTR